MAKATTNARIKYEYIKRSAVPGAKGVVKVNECLLIINNKNR